MGCQSPRHEELRRTGWTRQFTASDPRLSEMTAHYRAIGFEVLTEPVVAHSSEAPHGRSSRIGQSDLHPSLRGLTRSPRCTALQPTRRNHEI